MSGDQPEFDGKVLYVGKCSRFGCGQRHSLKRATGEKKYEYQDCTKCGLTVILQIPELVKDEPKRCGDCGDTLKYTFKWGRYACHRCEPKG